MSQEIKKNCFFLQQKNFSIFKILSFLGFVPVLEPFFKVRILNFGGPSSTTFSVLLAEIERSSTFFSIATSRSDPFEIMIKKLKIFLLNGWWKLNFLKIYHFP